MIIIQSNYYYPKTTLFFQKNTQYKAIGKPVIVDSFNPMSTIILINDVG